MAALFATHEDQFRKPCTGMWDYFSENLNDGIPINKDSSYYVGDAAGRDKGNGRLTKDHGYGDRAFAINLGIAFFTPEMFFLNQKETLPPLPQTIVEIFGTEGSIFIGKEYHIDPNNKHGNFVGIYSNNIVVFFIGPPGAGKSTLWNTKFKTWPRINNDTDKSIPKQTAIFNAAVAKNVGIVIDNTNKDKKQRSTFVTLAKANGYRTIALRFNITKDQCMALNALRKNNPHRAHLSSKVPDVSIHTFFKGIEEPSAEEFDEIYQVRTVITFANDAEEAFLKKISS